MGFCRRCGEIVAGTRCKCGGTAVAAVVKWIETGPTEQPKDRWSNTYVSREKSPTRPLSTTSIDTHPTTTTPAANSSPIKRFPRPASSISGTNTLTNSLGSRVSNHIASTTSSLNRPPSPLKHSTSVPEPHPESGVLPCPTGSSSLSKVYGSVLQPKESLAAHSCAICATQFPPDATIYPDPSQSSTETPRFLCKACFTTNGGSKGTCPTCSRPILTLKSDGGYVEAAGNYWHKRCFNCSGCFKNIGDKPMVDLLGRPCCADCFDDCLKRDSTPKKKWETSNSATNSPRVGGMGASSKTTGKSREGSPALEELEQRLGILKSKSRESSPSPNVATPTRSSPLVSRYSGTPSKYSTTSRETSPFVDRSFRGSPSPVRRYERLKSPETDQEDESIPSRTRYNSGSPSPVRPHITGGRSTTSSPGPTEEAIEEMKRRFLGSTSSPASYPVPSTPPLTIRRKSFSPSVKSMGPLNFPSPTASSRIPASSSSDSKPNAYRPPSPASSASSIDNSVPSTPDLVPDFSDETTTLSSLDWDSPPSSKTHKEDEKGRDDDDLFKNTAKVFGQGYGSRYTKGDFLEPDITGRTVTTENNGIGLGIVEDDEETPTHTPSKYGTMGNSLRSSISSSTLKTPTKSPKPNPAPPSTSSYQSRPLPHPQSKPHAITIPPPPVSPSAKCAKCNKALFSVARNSISGRFVTVPDDPSPGQKQQLPRTYHAECFTCYVCDAPFKEGGGPHNQAVFVKGPGGPCHVECAPLERVNIRPVTSSPKPSIFPTPSTPSPGRTRAGSAVTTSTYSSSRYDHPPLTAPATSVPTSFPRFGSSVACPGCRKSVSPMEKGVVPGPQGSRWHATCLVCGGKKEVTRGRWAEERKKDEPGCGKRLDSAAKSDGEGGVWCRECLLLLPTNMRSSPQGSPTRAPIVPSHTGSGKVSAQFTGTTTLVRQFTGLGGGSDAALLRQLTGGGLSPTRQLGSPTKQLSMMGPPTKTRPRPKSVIGMRNTKSVDEGRGMFLVRQMTGGAGGLL